MTVSFNKDPSLTLRVEMCSEKDPSLTQRVEMSFCAASYKG